MASLRSALLLASACGWLVFAGCSSSASPGMPGASQPGGSTAQSTRHGWISPDAKKSKLLYVSDYTASIILIYRQGDIGFGPIGEITAGISSPQGIAVDAAGTLYVANYGSNSVTEYLAGTTSPSVTLTSGITKPLDVNVDSKGDLYVTNNSLSTIVAFEPGSTSPDVTIDLSKPSNVTTSKKRELFATYNNGSGHVEACKSLSTTCTDLGITVELAQGLTLDKAGNMLVGDVFGQVIDIYAPGATSPFRTISVSDEQPGELAFDTKGTTLYMADPANFAIRMFDYSSGTQTGMFTYGPADELEGIALSPGQKPGK
jgi:sugar lactone lactonase YvrE